MKIASLLLLTLLAAPVLIAQTIPQFSVTMSPQDYTLLYSRPIFSDSLLPASLVALDSSWSNAQIRFKGNSTRYYPKKGFRMRFANSNFFFDQRQVNFNAMYTDKSFIREKLAWELFEDLNALAPTADHMRLSINGQPQGLYILIDKIDRFFLSRKGRTLAPMYEATDDHPHGDLSITSDSLLRVYYPKEVGNASDYSDLKQLINALNLTSDASFADTVHSYFDMKSVLDWFTANILMMMGDTYQKNYYLHRDTLKQSQQWSIIPWDYDLSFGRSGDPGVPYPGSLLNDGFAYSFPPLSGPSNVLKDRFLQTPSLMEQLRLHVDSILQTVFTEERMHQRIDSLAVLVEPEVAADYQKWGTMQDFYDHIDALKYYVTARRNFLFKTFINPPGGLYNIVRLPVSQLNVPYHFVGFDGRQIATLTFTSMSGLDSILIQAYPDSTPPGIPNASANRHVHRWLTITPYPSNAQFAAKLQWMYEDISSVYREVGGDVQDERLLKSNYFDGSEWHVLPARLNPISNTITMDSITQDQCGDGRRFALFMSENYTQTWFRQPLNYWQKWYDIFFTDAVNGLIVGEHGTVLKTTDGGTTWSERNVGVNLTLRTVVSTHDTVFVAGDNGTLMRSTDFGESWAPIDVGSTSRFDGLENPFSGILYLYGQGAPLRSTDNGRTWSAIGSSPVMPYAGLVDRYGTTTSVNEGVYHFLTDGSYQYYRHTNDVLIGNLPLPRVNAVRSYSDVLWILGDSGKIFSMPTETPGNWFDFSLATAADLHEAAALDDQRLYVAGSGGNIFYTTDGGSHWYSQYTADSHDLLSVIFTDDTHGFAVGSGGTILKTNAAGTVTGVEEPVSRAVPKGFILSQNYPNPFNPVTDIRYQISDVSRVTLSIYDILGREVATLVDEELAPGNYRTQWNASGNASGVYFYRMEVWDGGGRVQFSNVKKMLLMR